MSWFSSSRLVSFFFLLAIVFVLVSSGPTGFHVTFDYNGGFPIIECHPDVSKFKKGVRCCYDNTGSSGPTNDCSPLDPNNNDECFTSAGFGTKKLFMSYSEAETACQSAGRYLCTLEEYNTFCVGTGCSVNLLEAWTTDNCTPFFYAVSAYFVFAMLESKMFLHFRIDKTQ